MSEQDNANRFVIVSQLTAAQSHLGQAIAAYARGGTPHDGMRDALEAIGHAWYWLGRIDERQKQQEARDE